MNRMERALGERSQTHPVNPAILSKKSPQGRTAALLGVSGRPAHLTRFPKQGRARWQTNIDNWVRRVIGGVEDREDRITG